MNQQPPWQPPEPPYGQQPFGQQQWDQQVPPYQPPFYNQPTQEGRPGQFQQPPYNNFPPPKRQSGIWQWYKSRTKKVKISIGCGAILAVLLLFACIGTAVGSVNLATQSTPTPTTQSNQAAIPASSVVTTLPTPTPSSIPSPTQTPTPTHAPQPTQPPAKPTPCPGINCNPWGYNFTLGNLIYRPPSNFCAYFNCIASFWNGSGYVVECQDTTYSLSGGTKGACFRHGGVLRTLYSH
jgi:hypothetical protein